MNLFTIYLIGFFVTIALATYAMERKSGNSNEKAAAIAFLGVIWPIAGMIVISTFIVQVISILVKGRQSNDSN